MDEKPIQQQIREERLQILCEVHFYSEEQIRARFYKFRAAVREHYVTADMAITNDELKEYFVGHTGKVLHRALFGENIEVK